MSVSKLLGKAVLHVARSLLTMVAEVIIGLDSAGSCPNCSQFLTQKWATAPRGFLMLHGPWQKLTLSLVLLTLCSCFSRTAPTVLPGSTRWTTTATRHSVSQWWLPGIHEGPAGVVEGAPSLIHSLQWPWKVQSWDTQWPS
jgi:hypothetical protein